MLKCGDCGYLNRPEVRFCENCGGTILILQYETSDLLCPACGTKNRSGIKFCENCGGSNLMLQVEEAVLVCPNCGFRNRSGIIFCEKCGSSIPSGGKPQKVKSASAPTAQAVVLPKKSINPSPVPAAQDAVNINSACLCEWEIGETRRFLQGLIDMQAMIIGEKPPNVQEPLLGSWVPEGTWQKFIAALNNYLQEWEVNTTVYKWTSTSGGEGKSFTIVSDRIVSERFPQPSPFDLIPKREIDVFTQYYRDLMEARQGTIEKAEYSWEDPRDGLVFKNWIQFKGIYQTPDTVAKLEGILCKYIRLLDQYTGILQRKA